MTKLSLDEIVLLHGSHKSPEEGMCVMEAVAYVAGEPHSDHPKCASPVITNLLISLNDRWDADDRQLLKPYIERVINTATGPADEETRRWMLTDWLVHEYAPAIFRHVGLTTEAEQFEQLGAIASLADWDAARGLIYEVRNAQWARRTESRKRLKAQAVAVAVADAVAAAAADAVADADAVAAADAFKSKVEEATAAAVAVVKTGGGYSQQYVAAKKVFQPFYDERYKAMFGELGLKESVLGLVDRLIAVSDKTEVAA